jgi:DNA-binding transcriptional LysR family regulator
MLENFRLRVFREVAAQTNFRRAAEMLYISQPAVTQQIKALEEELGARLFDRSGGRVRLTAAGEALLRRAQESETLLQLAAEEVASVEGEIRGELNIAASTTIAQYVLPALLAEFAGRYPGVALKLESANTERVLAAVASGSSPLGLIEGPAHRQDLLIEPWLVDELVLVVPAAHEWAGETISVATLKTASLLVREQGSGTRAVLERALADAGTPLGEMQLGMELGSTEALLACVEAGLGVGFASLFALHRQRALGTLAVVRISGLRVTRELSVVRVRGPQPVGIADAFLGHLHAFAASFREEREKRRSKR